MLFSPIPRCLVPLRRKYSPKYPILKHSHPMFLPQCERPSFTPIGSLRTIEYCAEALAVARRRMD